MLNVETIRVMSEEGSLWVEDLAKAKEGDVVVNLGPETQVFFRFDTTWDVVIEPSFNGVVVDADLVGVEVRDVCAYADGVEVAVNEQLAEAICKTIFIALCEDAVREGVCLDDRHGDRPMKYRW